MPRSGEEILADIDATLDQLICYANAAQNMALDDLEVEALQKTQESLLARLIHMDNLLANERKKPKAKSYQDFQQKIARYSRLNAQLIDGVASQFARRSKARLSKTKARVR